MQLKRFVFVSGMYTSSLSPTSALQWYSANKPNNTWAVAVLTVKYHFQLLVRRCGPLNKYEIIIPTIPGFWCEYVVQTDGPGVQQ